MIPMRARPLLTVVAAVILALLAPSVHAAKFKQVDWSDFIETPEERAKWERKVAERTKKGGGTETAMNEDDDRPKAGKGKKAKKAKKAKKSKGKARAGKRKRG